MAIGDQIVDLSKIYYLFDGPLMRKCNEVFQKVIFAIVNLKQILSYIKPTIIILTVRIKLGLFDYG